MSNSAISLKGTVGQDALRNLINNASFNEWNFGSTFEITSPSNKVAIQANADGWFNRYFADDGSTGENMKIDQRPHDIGQTKVEGNPLYFTRIQNGGITSNQLGREIITLSQRIPNVIGLQNETVSLSFYAKGYTTDQKLGVGFTQVFGISGGAADVFGRGATASNPTQVTGQEVTLSTDWKQHRLRFNIDSIVGKTIGTTGLNYTELNFFIQAGATTANRRNLPNPITWHGTTVDIANVQVEKGIDFSTFENIQQNNAFRQMIGAHIHGIAQGQITKAADSIENALSLTYSDLTSIGGGNDLFINLNDRSETRNNILKYGIFVKDTDSFGFPIFIVSSSVVDSTASNELREVHCIGETVPDHPQLLKVTSFADYAGSSVNMNFNVMAFQLGSPAPGTFANSNEGNTDDGEYDGGTIIEGPDTGGDSDVDVITGGCSSSDSEYDPGDVLPCF